MNDQLLQQILNRISNIEIVINNLQVDIQNMNKKKALFIKWAIRIAITFGLIWFIIFAIDMFSFISRLINQ